MHVQIEGLAEPEVGGEREKATVCEYTRLRRRASSAHPWTALTPDNPGGGALYFTPVPQEVLHCAQLSSPEGCLGCRA